MIRKNGGEITNSNKSNYQLLLEKHAWAGKDFAALSKDEQYELCAEYVKHLFAEQSRASSDTIEIAIPLYVLDKLSSRIYNDKVGGVDDIKEAVIEVKWCDVNDDLDKELEASDNRYRDRIETYKKLALLNITNAIRQQKSKQQS
jgi:hypothetical protein